MSTTADQLRLAGLTGLLLGVVGVVTGAVVVVVDLARTDDEMHGLGVLIGVVVMVLCALPTVLGAVVLRVRSSRPQLAAVLTVVLGVVLCVLAPALLGFFFPYAGLPALLLGLAVLGLGVAALVRLHRQDRPVQAPGPQPR